MNILYICDEYPPGKIGGIGSVVKSLSSTLSSLGHNVYVVGLYPHGFGGKHFEEQEHVKIWRFRYATDIGLISERYNLMDKIILHGLRKSGILKIDAAIQLNRLFGFIADLVKKHSIQIIEMPDWNNFYFNAPLKSIQIPDFGIPLIVKMHGTMSYFNIEQNIPVSKMMFSKELAILKRADAICSVSEYTSRYCKSIYKLNNEIKVMYNGVVVRNFIGVDRRANKNHVIFTGSLFYKKGIYSLVRAWKNVVERIPEATLHIYGKGDKNLLVTLLDDTVKGSVYFYGHVDRGELMLGLEQADLAVFPSYTETFGLGVVEAMSCGCPVIYTNRSCGPEIVADRLEGLLVNPDDPDGISSTIVKLLEDKFLRKKYSEAAYAKVLDRFNLEKNAQAHIDYYNEIIEKYERT